MSADMDPPIRAYILKKRMGGIGIKRCLLLLLLLLVFPVSAHAVELTLEAPSALLMEKSTGEVLYAKNEHQSLEPASITKVMTLLLTMEAIEKVLSPTRTWLPSAPMPHPWVEAMYIWPRVNKSPWKS